MQGIVAIWSGAIVDIPAGWLICDGTNDTPDLRDRFVLGAGGSANPNDTGGTSTHTHTFTSNGHIHDFAAGTAFGAGTVFASETLSQVVTGTTNSSSNIPQYYALAYIIKIL